MFKIVQLKAKERELNALKTILKQSLANGSSASPTTTNSTNDTLNFNLNDFISQLNSANLMNTISSNVSLANGHNSASSSDLYSSFVANQPQPSPSPTNAQSTNYLPKI